MILTDASSIRDELEKLYNLQDCVITNVKWEHQGTNIAFYFNYSWTDDGRIRPNLNIDQIVVLRFNIVQQFYVKNALNSSMVSNPEYMNWGLSEVAAVRLANEEKFLAPYKELPVSFHHVIFVWEHVQPEPRHIDIVFSTLEIEKLWEAE